MALHVARQQTDEAEIELVGIRLDRQAPPRYRDLINEVAHLRDLIAAKDAHISSLETQVWAWRSQASNEVRSHKTTREAAWERECDLIRVIHQQTLVIQGDGESVGEAQRRRWWTRSA